MISQEKCPFCGSPQISTGEIYHQSSLGPNCLRFSQVNDFSSRKFESHGNPDAFRYIEIENSATACLSCGMLWTKFDLPTARDLIERYAPAEFKAAMLVPGTDPTLQSQYGQVHPNADPNSTAKQNWPKSDNPASTKELPESVVALIRQGPEKKIAAIKELRSFRPGIGLAEAKAIVEETGIKMGTMSATKGGCFIATACYENFDHPVVLELRRFRDDRLETSVAGQAFVRFYYKWSPAFAKHVAKSGILKVLAKVLIVAPALIMARIAQKMHH